MADVPNEESSTTTTLLTTQRSPAKRTKVRKGTRSCWECKRRKIRCIFTSNHVVCTGCQRRHVSCVPQDMPEELSPARKGNRHLGDRISKIEDFVRDILASKHGSEAASTEAKPHGDVSSKPNNPKPCSNGLAFGLYPSSLESTELAQNSSLSTPYSENEAPCIPDQSETETILHHLFKAFPSEGDTNILLRESAKPSFYTDIINTQPHSKQTLEALSGPYPTSRMPSRNTHPVIVARHMLMFAITLQTPSSESLFDLSEPHNVLMRRLTTAVTTWVTTKEEMHRTIEGLTCIILEGIFEINCGNLRRAWAVCRRAMTAAQLMGLHCSSMPPPKRIDPKLNADPKFIWFRIVHIDRYLSLLLGLPQGTSDKSVGAASVLRYEPPMGKFERTLTVIACHILERNESDFAVGGIATTRSIDSDLLNASKSMPASFWRPIGFHNLALGSPDTVLETTRLAAQVYYYGLVTQLHLPYMMRLGGNTVYEYSKHACVNASREIMTRFIAHRSFNPRSSCSRPVDFFALLAAMTLLLAHLEAHHHPGAANSLAHQRLGDRAMLDEALEKMDVVTELSKDIITKKSAGLIRKLLDIEADAANGNSYTTRSIREDDEVQEGSNGSGEIHLRIPYLGVIKIGRQGPMFGEPSQPQTLDLPQNDPTVAHIEASTSLVPASFMNNSPTSRDNSVARDCTSPADLREWEQPGAQLQTPEYDQSLPQAFSSEYDDSVLQSHMGIPPVAEDVNDWTFQGVDTAFFNSLMRGISCLDGVDLEQ
ncbi:hypothetical protein F5Y11DRAFT_53553 [Daldinia sp. FL1419]|nr:hypothetical protein F5Y11DRAFT_53553 [Daldinia sp. FL1419]